LAAITSADDEQENHREAGGGGDRGACQGHPPGAAGEQQHREREAELRFQPGEGQAHRSPAWMGGPGHQRARRADRDQRVDLADEQLCLADLAGDQQRGDRDRAGYRRDRHPPPEPGDGHRGEKHQQERRDDGERHRTGPVAEQRERRVQKKVIRLVQVEILAHRPMGEHRRGVIRVATVEEFPDRVIERVAEVLHSFLGQVSRRRQRDRPRWTESVPRTQQARHGERHDDERRAGDTDRPVDPVVHAKTTATSLAVSGRTPTAAVSSS
jgi:hypothetical protein